MTLLGEDLVLFRSRNGDLGLLDRHCSHRGASLEYGLPTNVGIQCGYHGWHFACDGRILDTPNDPRSNQKTACATPPTRCTNTRASSSRGWGRPRR